MLQEVKRETRVKGTHCGQQEQQTDAKEKPVLKLIILTGKQEIKLNTMKRCHEELTDQIVKILVEVMRAIKRMKGEK